MAALAVMYSCKPGPSAPHVLTRRERERAERRDPDVRAQVLARLPRGDDSETRLAILRRPHCRPVLAIGVAKGDRGLVASMTFQSDAELDALEAALVAVRAARAAHRPNLTAGASPAIAEPHGTAAQEPASEPGNDR